MSTIYITTQGATIQRRSGQLVVCRRSDILQNIPEAHVRQLVVCGNVHLTTPVMAFCLEQQIEVVFLTQGGRFQGRLNGNGGMTAQLRRKQYERALDAEFCLHTARAIVAGKIRNLAALARRQPNAGQRELAAFNRGLQSVERAATPDELLGVEGAASAAYFRLFAGGLPTGWTMNGRTAHPPQDAVNALLSLSYTLVYNRMVSNLNLIGFDPYQGFFHAVRHGHAALGSDMMENFRPVICDALVLKLLRRKQLVPGDVLKERGEWRLSVPATKVFFTEFEQKLNSRRKTGDAQGEMNLTYAEIMKRQCRQLARVVAGEADAFRPFTILK